MGKRSPADPGKQHPGRRENTSPDVKRGKRGKWLPGQSPNPGGRPKIIRDVIEAAREKAADAMHFLGSVVKLGQKIVDRVEAGSVLTKEHATIIGAAQRAADSIMDRAFGKAMQAHEHSGKDGRAIVHAVGELSDEQLTALITSAADGAGDGAGAAAPPPGTA